MRYNKVCKLFSYLVCECLKLLILLLHQMIDFRTRRLCINAISAPEGIIHE